MIDETSYASTFETLLNAIFDDIELSKESVHLSLRNGEEPSVEDRRRQPYFTTPSVSL